jgi:hypothetical protein
VEGEQARERRAGNSERKRARESERASESESESKVLAGSSRSQRANACESQRVPTARGLPATMVSLALHPNNESQVRTTTLGLAPSAGRRASTARVSFFKRWW